MNSILRTVSLLLLFTSPVALGKPMEISDNYPYEFSQVLTLGQNKIRLSVDDSYQLISHDLTQNHHTMGFVPDNEGASNWSQYININITVNTNQVASKTVRNLHQYLKRNYKNVKIYDTDISRDSSGLQEAMSTIFFTDEIGDVVVSVKYYSDNATLVGVEVSQRVRDSISDARSDAEDIADDTLSIKDI